MRQTFRTNARTTEAIRREIRNSEESVARLAKNITLIEKRS